MPWVKMSPCSPTVTMWWVASAGITCQAPKSGQPPGPMAAVGSRALSAAATVWLAAKPVIRWAGASLRSAMATMWCLAPTGLTGQRPTPVLPPGAAAAMGSWGLSAATTAWLAAKPTTSWAKALRRSAAATMWCLAPTGLTAQQPLPVPRVGATEAAASRVLSAAATAWLAVKPVTRWDITSSRSATVTMWWLAPTGLTAQW